MSHSPPSAHQHQPSLEAASYVQLVFDLCEESGSAGNLSRSPIQIVQSFGDKPVHRCRMDGSWDWDRAMRENTDRLLRSWLFLGRSMRVNQREDVLIQLGELEFINGRDSAIMAYAPTPERAQQLLEEFTKTYGSPAPDSGGSFYLMRQEMYGGIKSETVNLPIEALLSDELLSLYYPDQMPAWHGGFMQKLDTKKHGLSLFEGESGTGKTSYLRHLICLLKQSHRFYFIPPGNLNMLTEPEFIGFWSEERLAHPDEQFVVILEDAEAVLMSRESDNRAEVSCILNISDGMMADFLSLHVICTVNCGASALDPAVLRPGRLLAHRIFRRIPSAQAQRVAKHLNRELPSGASDHTLAEIFAENEAVKKDEKQVGFGF